MVLSVCLTWVARKYARTWSARAATYSRAFLERWIGYPSSSRWILLSTVRRSQLVEELDEHTRAKRLIEDGEVALRGHGDCAHRVEAEAAPAHRQQRGLPVPASDAPRQVVGTDPDLVEEHDLGFLDLGPLSRFGRAMPDPLQQRLCGGLDCAPVGALEAEAQAAQQLAHTPVSEPFSCATTKEVVDVDS
jgi:hypothetical protein